MCNLTYLIDPRYLHLIDLTLGDPNSTTFDSRDMYSESSYLIGHIHNRNKRSLLPLGGLLSFLFGTANQDDIDSIKQDVRTLYANQVDQSEALNELVTITNVSRGLINDDRNIINALVGTIMNLNDTIGSISDQLMPLFTARRFQLLHTEFLIHHNRIKDLIKQMKTDLDLIRSYLETHITDKLTSTIIDPVHLRQELIKIQKQLPPLIHLPEDPTENIWHYYRYLTVTKVSHDDNLILLL